MHTLEQLESGALAGAREVRLYAQGLTEFPPALLALAPTLELLDLGGNQLTTLPPAFAQLTQLRVLFASYNPFTSLPEVLGQMPQLETVGFRGCRITHVPAASLPPGLRSLVLTDNQLTTLPEAIGQCRQLRKLMLSCNRLSKLPGSLRDCHQLELLRLASNQLTEVPAVLADLPQLAWLALAGNPLTQLQEQAVLAAHQPHTIDYAQLQVHEALGQGASGVVYRATHCPNDGTGNRSLALKHFKSAHTSDGTPQSELAAGLFAGSHPHLLTPIAQVRAAPDGAMACALPLLPAHMRPLAAPPTLQSCTRDIYTPHPALTPAAAQQVLAQVSDAITHLHARGVLHGDVYAHNILWNPHSAHAVLSDLGAAMLLQGLPPAQQEMLLGIEQRALQVLRAELMAAAAPTAAESTGPHQTKGLPEGSP